MSSNRELLARVARKIEPLLSEVAFVGGAVIELYITSPVSEKIRPTRDTDVVCQVAGKVDYWKLGRRLEELGFQQSALENDPPYRWRSDGDIVDLLPTDQTILGFGNRWYEPGLAHAEPHAIAEDLFIKLLPPPYLLATKLEAYCDRGEADPLGSEDFEDVVVLIGNRPELVEEVLRAEPEVREWIQERIAELFPDDQMTEYLSAHLPVNTNPGLLGLVSLRVQQMRG